MSSFSIQQMIESLSVQSMGSQFVPGIELIRQYLDIQLRPTWNSLSSFQKEAGLAQDDLTVPPEYHTWLERRMLSPEIALKLRKTVLGIYAQRKGAHILAALQAIDEIQDAICGVGMQFTQRRPPPVECFDMYGNALTFEVQPWITDRHGELKVQAPAQTPGLVRAMLEPFDLLAYAYQCMPVTGGLAQIDDDLCILFEVPIPTRESEAQLQAANPDQRIKVDPARYRAEEQVLERIQESVGAWQVASEKPWLTVLRPTGSFVKTSAHQVLWGIVRTVQLRQPGVGVNAVVGSFKDMYSLAAEATLV